jgi:iron complex transport system substrate-binding protein
MNFQNHNRPRPGTRFGIAGALALAFAFTAPSASVNATVIHDARGHDVNVENPKRVVAIGGAVTEILYALGLEDRIFGIDTTSLYPKTALADKPNVGYMRQLSSEGVLGLNPQLILAIEGSGPKETLEVLETAKVPLISVPDKHTAEGVAQKISLIAHAMDADARGACLATAVKTDLASLTDMRARIKTPVRVMFVMSFLNGRAMVAGQKTAANAIIKMSGAVNAIDSFDGYKPINDEAIVAAKPDVILTMKREREEIQKETIFSNPAFALTPAAKTKSFVAMDGLYLLGFGPRTAVAAHDLATKLYPALSTATPAWTSAVLAADCRH